MGVILSYRYIRNKPSRNRGLFIYDFYNKGVFKMATKKTDTKAVKDTEKKPDGVLVKRKFAWKNKVYQEGSYFKGSAFDVKTLKEIGVL